jgi:hypothetical protein
MKQIPTEFFSITEIGGVGEMIYKAVRFPECVPEYDHAECQSNLYSRVGIQEETQTLR